MIVGGPDGQLAADEDQVGPSRAMVDRVLRPVRAAAFPPGEYIGQESFVTVGEIRELAYRSGIRAGTDVLDLCCGIAGPGALVARETGCRYLGLDQDPEAVALARVRHGGPHCRFEVVSIPPVPVGTHDVVLLVETMLAFRDKAVLLDGIAGALRTSGRFVCTFEEGAPLVDEEREQMPDADTVWPIPLAELDSLLQRHGFRVLWRRDCTREHRDVVHALIGGFTRHRERIAATLGAPAIDKLLAGHRLWSGWMNAGRIRKFAMVAGLR